MKILKFHNLAVLGILIILVCSLLGYLGRFNYLLDLTNHFHVYYWLGALILLAFFLFTKKWRWIGVALICLILNSVVLYPWTVRSLQDNDPDPDGWASIKLVHSNVEYDNTDYAQLISYVNETSPDVLVLQEINKEWMPHLTELPKTFPYSKIEPSGHGSGIAIYSKIPFEKVETLDLCAGCRLSLYAQFKVGEHVIDFVTMHPSTPISPGKAAARNRQFEAVANYLNTLANRKILLGDFNDTMWSYHHAQLLEKTKLVNVRTRAKSFINPSWPSWLMLKPLMIPIDQCLISPNIWVSSVKTGRDIGSDHLPLEVKLLFAPPKKN